MSGPFTLHPTGSPCPPCFPASTASTSALASAVGVDRHFASPYWVNDPWISVAMSGEDEKAQVESPEVSFCGNKNIWSLKSKVCLSASEPLIICWCAGPVLCRTLVGTCGRKGGNCPWIIKFGFTSLMNEWVFIYEGQLGSPRFKLFPRPRFVLRYPQLSLVWLS